MEGRAGVGEGGGEKSPELWGIFGRIIRGAEAWETGVEGVAIFLALVPRLITVLLATRARFLEGVRGIMDVDDNSEFAVGVVHLYPVVLF